ncbi:Flp pilus assembly protein CpaB [Acetobacterium woodii]|uniref:SAF domain containing protein n=1 Tax=Acetobacterium woodii (strain ATCC 29683 / DSM 1030 / JCM 2381 / KCTC 1655 / WB1) TaxID=931626 RepID=H6LDE5_ACEWD|nr:RcpC/CpaB family pilus assembly protein [Acetobacterium woodii]AFA47917.1 SAF domain containing protein [Acetobacterium woodii DSM 1030]
MKNKGKIVVGFFTVLISLLVAVVIPIVIGMIGNTTEIVKVKETIKANGELTRDNLEMVEMTNYNLPTNAIKNIDDVIGKYTTARLEPGDYVLESKLVGDLIESGNYLGLLDGNKQVVSVTVKDLASGMSGKLTAGDIVSIFNSAEMVNGLSKAYPELQYIKVLAVTTASGIDLEGEAYTKDSELPATVTLLVNQKQAELVTAMDKQGNPVFSLVFPHNGEESLANAFLEKQDQYFKTGNNNGSI